MTAPLREGSRGPDVRALQWMLLATGHDPGPLDGVFGPRTRSAVGAYGFSRKYYSADGAIGPNWILALMAEPRLAVEVPRALTPASLVDVRAALATAYAEAFCRGAACDDCDQCPACRNAVRVALAHLAMEHGLHAWTPALAREHAIPWWLSPPMDALAFAEIWGGNLGNRQVRREDMSGHAPAVPHFVLRSREVIGGKDVVLAAPYYAYPDLAESARGYWASLRDHYPAALAAMEAGGVPGTARRLKEEGWYTGSEQDYAAGMVTSWGRVG